MLLGLKMTGWSALLVFALSLLLVHMLVYYVEFRDHYEAPWPRRRLLLSSATTYALTLAWPPTCSGPLAASGRRLASPRPCI